MEFYIFIGSYCAIAHKNNETFIAMFRKKALRINTYLGYGTTHRFRAMGRALEAENINFEGRTSTLKTVRNIYRQLESDELPHTAIAIQTDTAQQYTVTTDAEGYYQLEQRTDQALIPNHDHWFSYTVGYKDLHKQPILHQNCFEAAMLIPPPNASYGIISDIDDTILHTGVASLFKWKVIANTVFKNFDKRIALEGTADLYKKLQVGTHPQPTNPIFYISNSPWNLYDYLTAFLKKNEFPKGPILLRDFRIPFDKTPKPKTPHKIAEINTLLEVYPQLPFILIGDSAEKDADIYIEAARKYPGRILAIYLRCVQHKRKERRIQALIRQHADLPILLVNSAQEATIHAREQGFIL